MTPLRELFLRHKKYSTHALFSALIICVLTSPLQAQEAQLPDDEAILVMHTSELAAAAKNCNLEWQPYLDAFMSWQDRRGMWSEVQINSIKGLFLFAQDKYMEQLPEDYCSAEQLVEIKALTAERIGVLATR